MNELEYDNIFASFKFPDFKKSSAMDELDKHFGWGDNRSAKDSFRVIHILDTCNNTSLAIQICLSFGGRDVSDEYR